MLVSDNGPQFTASEFAKFCQSNGIEHKRTPPYHPASNGQVERIVQELKKALRKSSRADPGLTVSHFLSAYRDTLHSVTQQTPAAIIFRHVPVTRFQLLQPNFGRCMQSQQFPAKASRSFLPGEEVYSFDHRTSKWMLAIILQRIGPLTYSVSQNGKTRHVHVKHIRAFVSSHPVTDNQLESLPEVRMPAPPPLIQQPAADIHLPSLSDETVPATSVMSHETRTPQAVRLFVDLPVLIVVKLPID